MSQHRFNLSWKALLAGSLTVLILGLLMQLLFVALAVGQLMIIRQYPQLELLAQVALYLCGVLLLFLAMAAGGYLTARIARSHLLIHGTVVALIAGGISFVQSFSVGGLTLVGVLLFMLGIPFTLAGCWLARRQLQYLSW